eukprot:884551_1
MHITAILKPQGLILNQSNIVVNIDECSIGSGYDHDAILLDCVDCAVNSFKMTRANAPCFVCTRQNGFSCDGQSNVTIHYNMWLTSYKKETNTFMPLFNITSNHKISIDVVKC